MSEALRITHAVLSLDVGGLERIVLDLVRVGRRRGHTVSVICLEKPGKLAASVEAAGAKVVSLNKPPGRVNDLGTVATPVFAELRPDVLHTHQVGALWYLGPVAAAARVPVPVLHTEHIDNVAKAVGPWRKLKTRILWHKAARFAGRFCCVSDDVARSAGRWGTVPRQKLDVILNGIDTERYTDPTVRTATRAALNIPATARVVGTVGRLNEVKQQDLLLRALARLGEGFDDVHALIVGDGPERQRLEQLSAKLKLDQRTHFAGYQPDPERFLPAMDVFALTSRLEGLPLAMLEAWAAGVPVASTAVGGIPKVVVDGETGLLFQPGDETAAAVAIRKLLTEPDTAARLAAGGRAVVQEKYSLERMATDYETRYRQLLAERGR